MTAALEGCELSAARPGRNLPSGKNQYPFYRRLRGPQGQSGRAEYIVPNGIFLIEVVYLNILTSVTLCIRINSDYKK